MFDFEKQYKESTKQFEELAERIKDMNEFWFTTVFSSAKEFFKQARTK
jgi:DNA-binding ferritin-like protein